MNESMFRSMLGGFANSPSFQWPQEPPDDDDDKRWDGGAPVPRRPRTPKGSPGTGVELPRPDKELVGV